MFFRKSNNNTTTISVFLITTIALLSLVHVSGSNINNVYAQEYDPYYVERDRYNNYDSYGYANDEYYEERDRYNDYEDNGYGYANDLYYEEQYIKEDKKMLPGNFIKNKVPLFECTEGPMVGAIVTDELLCQAPNDGNVCPEGTEMAGIIVTDIVFCGLSVLEQTITINKTTSCDSDKVGEEVCSNIPDAKIMASGNNPRPSFFLESQTPINVTLREGPYSIVEEDFTTGFERCSEIAIQFDAGRNLPQFGSDVFICSTLSEECSGNVIDDGDPLSCNMNNVVFPRVQDLAVAVQTNPTGGGNAAILLGNGDGTFGAAADFPVTAQARYAAVGFFNADSNLDLAVANSVQSGSVSILLGNGDGTFIEADGSPISVGSAPSFIAVDLFNQDSHLDLAVANAVSNDVSILLGNGDGTFGAATDFSVRFDPNSIAVGLFNADTNLDLAVANAGSNSITVRLGNGDGTFGPRNDFQVGIDPGVSPESVAVGLFNADTNLDLVTANSGAGNGSDAVSVLLGNGDGTFNTTTSFFPAGDSPKFVAVGLFNADTDLDLAVANRGGNTGPYFVSILLGKGDGTFGAATNLPVGDGPTGVAVGNFNADTNLDLAVVNQLSSNISILLGNVDGTFGAATNFPVGGASSFSVAVGNFS